MKVVVLASLAFSLTQFRGALLASMVREGHEVVACAPEEDPEVERVLAAMGVRYQRIAMWRTNVNPFADLWTLAGLIRLIQREKPHVILAYTQKPIIYGGIAAQLVGTARFFAMVSGLGYVFSADGQGGRRLLRAMVSRLYRFGIRKADAVFVFNGDDRAEMLKHGILRQDHHVVQVPGSGVDISRFAPTPLPQGAPVFLLIARLLREKGVPEYVEAARRLRAQYPELRMQILGPLDPNPSRITPEQLAAWVAEGAVEYLGATRDVTPYIAAATVYVLPSCYREGLPRTILEAMAMGRPIITTDSPGCREPVVPGDNGFLVPVHEPAALAEAMMRFVRDPDLAPRMGRRSRELAEERFDVAKVNAILLAEMGLRDDHASTTATTPSTEVELLTLDAGAEQ